MKILINGSLAYDRIMNFPGNFDDHILADKINILNVCFLVDKMVEKFGGTAGNIAYSLALLGESPVILSTSGFDFDRYEAWLTEQGLSLEGIKRYRDVPTAGAYITTDANGNQITMFNPGAMNFQSEYSLDGLNPDDTLVIISPTNTGDMMNYGRECRARGIRYIFDPGQQIPVFSGEEMTEAITGAYVLISNDYELEMIMQATGLGRDDLMKRTENIITTLGEQGSRVLTPAGEVLVPSVKVDTVADPTGAGDAFRSGLIKGLTLGLDLAAAARVGAVSAGYAVEHYGTQEHGFSIKEFWARYEDAFGPAPVS